MPHTHTHENLTKHIIYCVFLCFKKNNNNYNIFINTRNAFCTGCAACPTQPESLVNFTHFQTDSCVGFSPKKKPILFKFYLCCCQFVLNFFSTFNTNSCNVFVEGTRRFQIQNLDVYLVNFYGNLFSYEWLSGQFSTFYKILLFDRLNFATP